MRHKVVAHKVINRQFTVISFSPVIQIKLCIIFYQQNDCEKLAISMFV